MKKKADGAGRVRPAALFEQMLLCICGRPAAMLHPLPLGLAQGALHCSCTEAASLAQQHGQPGELQPLRAPAAQGSGKEGAPNKILFVQNLPEASNTSMLTMLFQQFPGLKEVRMVDARPGIAFVEFETDTQSSTAMAGLQNFIIAEKPMSLTFAKQ